MQDFRLRDIGEYEEWYGQPHKATDLQVESIFYTLLLSQYFLKHGILMKLIYPREACVQYDMN